MELIKCNRCDKEKPVDQMRQARGTGKVNRARACLDCTKIMKDNWKKENPDYWKNKDPEKRKAANSKWAKNKYRFTRHGTTKEEYDHQVVVQMNRCAICKETVDYFHIDHDHACCDGRSCGDCLRGLLCQKCNHALGLFNDDLDILSNAIKYLEVGGVWA